MYFPVLLIVCQYCQVIGCEEHVSKMTYSFTLPGQFLVGSCVMTTAMAVDWDIIMYLLLASCYIRCQVPVWDGLDEVDAWERLLSHLRLCSRDADIWRQTDQHIRSWGASTCSHVDRCVKPNSHYIIVYILIRRPGLTDILTVHVLVVLLK